MVWTVQLWGHHVLRESKVSLQFSTSRFGNVITKEEHHVPGEEAN
jgi:hypothetical protein